MASSYIVARRAELLAYLFATLPTVKKANVRQWLKHGSIYVNGSSTTQFNHVLQPGDVVAVRPKKPAQARSFLPSEITLLFEDAALAVIEKPAGLLSMASQSERRRTAYAMLTDYVRAGDPRSPARAWIVHRLDREASGLMVFAKTETAKRTLQAHWHEARKRYLAVVEGAPPADAGVMSSHLDESGPYKVFSAPPSDQTRLATTEYRVLKRNASRALVELTLRTGRRNQIRVHLADAKCPIVGDHKYGARTNPARRLGLHACTLEFKHPSSEELLRFDSPLPGGLAGLV